ncbi:hypothetical protein SELMODRAFT_31384, partial [Selaginella moellendorffii]
NTLMHSYGRCGCVDEARRVFDAIPQRNPFSWNILATAYIHNGFLQEAKRVLDRMPQPSAVSWNLMLAAYSREGLTAEARAMFDSMPELNSMAWNSILSGYAHTGHCVAEVLTVFQRMPGHDVISWNTLLLAISETGDAGGTKRVFDGMAQRTLVSWTCAMQANARTGDVVAARDVFDKMPLRDVVAWTAMLQAYAQDLDSLEALFRVMPQRDAASWSLVITAYGEGGDAWKAKHTFDAMPGSSRNLSCWNALCHAYLYNGQLAEAGGVLHRMSKRDVVAWNGMLSCCVQRGEVETAEALLRDTLPERSPVSWSTVVCGYAQSRKLDDAREIFHGLPASERDVVSWTALFHACALNNRLDEAALVFFRDMPDKNHVSWNAMAAAYARAGHTAEAKAVLEQMPCHDVVALTVIFHLAVQSGRLEHARSLFDNVVPEKDLVAWNAMIGAYAQNGQGDEALLLYREMHIQGMDPDDVTMSSILAAHSRLGQVEQGRSHFVAMPMDHGITPSEEHYACMVDALGRSGQLVAAEELLATFPFHPSYVAWGSFLAGCRINQDVARGERAAQIAAVLDPSKCAPYVLLS